MTCRWTSSTTPRVIPGRHLDECADRWSDDPHGCGGCLPCTEDWRPVPGYEGHYEVSDQGRIKSLKHGRERILSGRLSSAGYPSASFRIDGIATNRTIHRIVALVFIGPCPPGHEVLHWDGDRTNAAASNLRYGTRSENMKDAVRHGTLPQARHKTHCKRGHEFTDANTRIEPTKAGGWSQQCRTCINWRRREARQRKATA